MAIVIFLIRRLVLELAPELRGPLIGTAIVIFVFRAAPRPGPGATWFQIDVLGFDQQFISVLSLITSVLTLAGLVALRPCSRCRTSACITACTSGRQRGPTAWSTRVSSRSWTPPWNRRSARSR
jgi:hypothetical protein